MYTGIASVGFVTFLLILPETKGKTLEEMETVFDSVWQLGNRRMAGKAPSEKTQLKE